MSIEIPNSVATIGEHAFESCKALPYVSYSGANDPGKTSKDVFVGCDNLDSATVTEKYVDNVFCGQSISRREVFVEIKPRDKNELINVQCGTGISKNAVSVEIKTNDDIYVVEGMEAPENDKVTVENKENKVEEYPLSTRARRNVL